MKYLLLSLSIFLATLSGCANGPTYTPMKELNPVLIMYYTHATHEELWIACHKAAIKYNTTCDSTRQHAWSIPGRPWSSLVFCQVHMVLNQWAELEEEIKHCLYGAWHDF